MIPTGSKLWERSLLLSSAGRVAIDISSVADLAPESYGMLLVQLPGCCQCRCVTSQKTVKTDSRLAARCAAVASIGAAIIHFAVAPMHWKDWMPSGVFFASIAVFQLLWGLLAWARPMMLLLIAGVLGNAGSAALWVLSRTAGAPLGPNAGEPEAVEAAGICVLLLQSYVVMGAGWALLRRYRAEEVSGFGRALVLLGANSVMAAAVTVGLASSLQGHHHHHGAEVEAEAEEESAHDGHMAGHQHGEDPVAPTDAGLTQPSPATAPGESGRPLTDMRLSIDGDQSPESPAPPEAGGSQPSLGSPASETGLEGEGHQHHHGD